MGYNYYIYKLTNTGTGEYYIGKTYISLERAYQQHKSKSNKGISNALFKSGHIVDIEPLETYTADTYIIYRDILYRLYCHCDMGCINSKPFDIYNDPYYKYILKQMKLIQNNPAYSYYVNGTFRLPILLKDIKHLAGCEKRKINKLNKELDKYMTLINSTINDICVKLKTHM